MKFRSSLRTALLVSSAALLAGAPAMQAQTKVFGQYWAWANMFGGAKLNSFSFGNGSNPQWTATFNFPGGSLYGYPASVRGWHYGYNPSGDRLFPKQLSTVTHIPASFSYASGGSNVSGDFAYDMFLRYDNNVSSGQSNPQLEVMVWCGNNSYPIGTRIVSNVYKDQNGVTYDLWYGDNSAAGYYVYSFIPVRNSVPSSVPASGSCNVDLRQFFNQLHGRPNYNASMYLDVVEAGIEITKGNGDAQVTYFTVDAY